MALLPPILVQLVADTKQFQAEFAKADATMGKFGATADASGARFGKFANKAANAIIGVGAVVGVTAIKLASNFQTLTTQLVTGAGESVKNLDMIRQGLLNMAGQVGQTPADLAKGLYLIESAGYHGAAGLKVLKAAAQGAKVGGADMATVAGAVTTVMHDYGIGVGKAGSVTSALIQTVASGKTHLEDLGNSLGKVIPTAAAMGISFQQVAAAMAVQTNAGMSARLAAMHTNALFLSLMAPNAKQLKVFSAIGLSTQKIKDMLVNPKEGLAYALDVINGRIGQQIPRGSAMYVQAMKAAYGTTAALSTALTVSGKHAKEFNDTAAKIGERMKSTTKDVQGWALAQKDLSTQMGKLKGAGESVLIGIGNWLLPKATAVAEWASGVINYFKEHPLLGKIAGDAAITAFAAAIVYKIGKGLYSAFSFVKSLFSGTAMTANTTATADNTIALGVLTDKLAISGIPMLGGTVASGAVAGEVIGGMTIAGAAVAAAAVVLPFVAAWALLHFTSATKPGWKPPPGGKPAGGPRGIPMTWDGSKWVPTYDYSGGHTTITRSGHGPRGGTTHVTVRVR